MERMDVAMPTGLTEAEAQTRLRSEGFNELPAATRRGLWALVLDVVREPMFFLLLSCGGLYVLLGEIPDAVMLLGFVFVVMGITIVQERRTERALDALRDLSSPRALVVRDGERKRIPGREVARGDVVVLAEGDRVPADMVLRRVVNLRVDESLLTGESLPVGKSAVEGRLDIPRPGGEGLAFAFSGTLVTGGQGVGEAVRTGGRTELGRIGEALASIKAEQTLMQRDTGRMVRRLAILGLMLCAVVVVAYALTRGNTLDAWSRGFLAGIAMAMAILPEELPVIMTIFLALGAWRISRSNVLTRRMPAIETLGAATVLCSDKTGTLTWNRMSVRLLHADGRSFDAAREEGLPESYHALLEYAILAGSRDPFDPMEKALLQLGEAHLAATEHWHGDWSLLREYPLSPDLLALSHVWHAPERDVRVVAAKGAPEAVLDLCHVPEAGAAPILETVASMAAQGLRVLGVARSEVEEGLMPSGQHDMDFRFLGLVGLEDPIRENVPAAVEECHDAGIRVIMITGDYPGTARSIARRIGLQRPEAVLTGAELEDMGEEELAARISEVSVFARVVPEQKLRIVNALKARGEIVAMTGDGVNDAPALKAAHIGIAMGSRGTDVAREASDLVLLDDDFSSIVKAVRLGRRIFDNIRKAMGYIFAIHVPIAGLSMIPVFFRDWPLLLLPMHIVFLELIIDPACSLVFEAEREEPDVMNRPPRGAAQGLFSARLVALSVMQGVMALAFVFGVYWLSGKMGHPQADARRAFAFTTLVAANIGLILTNRSWSRTLFAMFREPNRALWWVLGGAAALLGLVLGTPGLRGLFHFSALHGWDLALCLTTGCVSVLWFEVLKLFGLSLDKRRP